MLGGQYTELITQSGSTSSLTAHLWQVQALTQVPIVFKGLYIGQDDDVLEALNHFQHRLQNRLTPFSEINILLTNRLFWTASI